MSSKVKITLNYKNEKEKEVKLGLYIDKEIFSLLNDVSVNQNILINYLVDEYHFIESNKKFKRKVTIKSSLDYIPSKEKDSIDKRNYNILKLLNALSFRQQQIIKMKFFENKNQTQIAKELNITKQSVSKTYKRAIKKLQDLIKK